ncbi:hypothetical protein AN964_07710 [Heyndrickxia shackletonii]|uniref:G5 domain-containing protein n=1 Tax=Heyndrickxia shackletonii TaxID=157838 RepID=A0A0Q3WUT2_9BACI|nr:VanW family protein [Heyndrickxia shackletonii]KQL53389.1 hypothetical protein AN964_07710 [Heyndrickxia shackletonii]NEY99956.1 hypothetical protein [Heyndrickxia shackletonii]
MAKKNIVVFISIILCSTIFLIILSQLTVVPLSSVLSNEKDYLKNTKVGSVNISSLNSTNAEEKVNAQINNWKAKKKIQLSFLNKRVELPDNVFMFMVSDTFKSIQNGKENPLSVEINNNELVSLFRQLGMVSIIDEIDLSKLKAFLKQDAANLTLTDLDINMEKYLTGYDEMKQTVISSNEVVIYKPNFINNWLKEHKTIILKPNKLFSFQNTVKGLTDADSLGRLSSALYKAILQSNIQVVERNISQTKPDNIPLGFEANVQEDLDLKLYNPNSDEIKIISKKTAFNKMNISIIGPMSPLKYVISEEDEQVYPQRKILEYVPTKNLERTIKGKNGYSIEVYKEVYYQHQLLERVLVSNDFYLPKDDVEYKCISSSGNSLEMDNNQLAGDGNEVTEDNSKSENNVKTEEDK